MPTPAFAAMVAMGTCAPSRCTAAVPARTSASWLRAASLRCSRGRGLLAMAMDPIEVVFVANGYTKTDEILRIEGAESLRTHRRTSPPGSPGKSALVDPRGDKHVQPARTRPARRPVP